MAYECANCGIGFDNPKSLVEHMIDKHDSPYLEGSEQLVNLSVAKAQAEKDVSKKNKLAEKFAAHGRVI